jgi:hypothetical protein
MNAAAIVIIAIAATGVPMMRFHKRWLAKINIAFPSLFTTDFRSTPVMNNRSSVGFLIR